MSIAEVDYAVACIQAGKLIAYPTEAVFGLGCDPFNFAACQRLSALKQRPDTKAFILIVANWQQLEKLITPVAAPIKEKILAKRERPTTWLLPPHKNMPSWIAGPFEKIAIRIVEHPQAQALCQHLGSAIISTSANLSHQPAARTEQEVGSIFGDKVDYIMPGTVGQAQKPSMIMDALTGEIIRG